jgi:hypothetical protein
MPEKANQRPNRLNTARILATFNNKTLFIVDINNQLKSVKNLAES